jgi:hypothetical protein
VPPLELQIVLAASPGKVRGVLQVELSWTIYDPLPMYVRRDGVTIAETDGASPSYLDVIGRKGESAYTYQVCVIDTNVCSNQVTVTF